MHRDSSNRGRGKSFQRPLPFTTTSVSEGNFFKLFGVTIYDHECFRRKFFQAVWWRGLLKVQIIWKNGTAKAWTSSQVQSGFSTQIWCFCAMSWVLYTRVPLHNLVVLNIRILYFCLARSCRRWWYWKDNLCQTSLDWRIWKKICWWVTYVIITSFRNFHRIRDTVCLNLTQNHVSTDISFILR